MFQNSSYSVQKQFVNFVGLEEAENGCLLTLNANCKLENYSYSETVLKSVIINVCVVMLDTFTEHVELRCNKVFQL